MEEKRRYIRLDTRLKITYTIVQQERSSRVTETEDISGGGIRIFLMEQLPVGTLIRLTIHLPQDPTPVSCTGKVVWNEEFYISPPEQKEGKVVEAGVEFTEIDPKDRDRIIKYVILGYAATNQ